MFTLAHLSDPHVPSTLALGLPVLATKRAFGYWSWRRRRVFVHSERVLQALAADLHNQAPDHVAVTGDLVNISLPSEFIAAARWLVTLGPGERVSVVPGNHDAYVAVPWSLSCALWSAYMTSDAGDGQSTSPSGTDDFPFVRRRGRIGVVGLSTAVPTPPGWASGRLGNAQLARLEAALSRLGAEGLFRVILIHHPAIEGDNRPRKRLTDAAALQRVVARCGAELILHGHDHRCTVRTTPGPHGGVPCVGVPSASAVIAGTKPIGQYHLYDITPSHPGWRVDLRMRRYSSAIGRFEDAGGWRLSPERDAPADLAVAIGG